MQLSEVQFKDQLPVDGYGPGFFRVADQVHHGAMFLNAQGVSDWAGLSDLSVIIAAKNSFDIIFIGTGAEIAPLSTDVRQALEDAEIPAEVMGSPSACRTYNILLSEGRRVALAVLPT